MAKPVRQADWMHMTDDEDILWAGKPSLWTVATEIAIGLVLIITGISFTIAFLVELPWVPEALTGTLAFAPLVIAAFGITIIALRLIVLRFTRYVITTEEVYRKDGIFATNVLNIRCDRIENTGCSQSIVERIGSFGDIQIYTSGTDSSEIILANVPNPQQIRGVLGKAQDIAAEKSVASESVDPTASGESGSAFKMP